MNHHVRVHTSVLASSEKQLLIRIANRLPRWIKSDHLTLLALVAMALAGAGYALARWDHRGLWLVVAALALNWFGDSLDGTLARVRRAERPRYGFYVDHVLDIVGITLLMGGLACSGFMTPVIALAVLVAYLLVAGEVFLATAVNGVFRVSFAGMGPTELRIVLAIGTLALFRDPHVDIGALGTLRMFDVGGLVATAGLGAALAVAVTRNAMTLARLEPPRSLDGHGGAVGADDGRAVCELPEPDDLPVAEVEHHRPVGSRLAVRGLDGRLVIADRDHGVALRDEFPRLEGLKVERRANQLEELAHRRLAAAQARMGCDAFGAFDPFPFDALVDQREDRVDVAAAKGGVLPPSTLYGRTPRADFA